MAKRSGDKRFKLCFHAEIKEPIISFLIDMQDLHFLSRWNLERRFDAFSRSVLISAQLLLREMNFSLVNFWRTTDAFVFPGKRLVPRLNKQKRVMKSSANPTKANKTSVYMF